MTKTAVANASAMPRSGPTTVALASSVVGCPVRGSMMCAPRS